MILLYLLILARSCCAHLGKAASTGAGEVDIDQMIADAQSKQANFFMVNVQNDGRTDDAALSLNIDCVSAVLHLDRPSRRFASRNVVRTVRTILQLSG